MYSIEEKRKAVQLYIDSNFSERIVINNLGYPSPNALRQWHREYTKTGMLHCKVERQQRYSQEQIKTAIAHYDEHDGSIIATCRALGYPNRNTMSQWIRENPQGKERPLSKRCKSYRELVRCSQEQKQDAVEAWMNGMPDYKIAAQYGVSKAAVYAWKKKLLGKEIVRMKKKDQVRFSEELPGNKKELEIEIRKLQAEVHRLKMERDILEKAAEILKKGHGINQKNLTNTEKSYVIDALVGTYRLCELLNSIKLSKSSYFYRQKATLRPDKYKDLRTKIKTVFQRNFQCYGYRRIHAELQKGGNPVSEKVVRRIMREENLLPHCTRTKRYNSYKGEITPAVPNIIKRDFHSDIPNKKWLTDLTEFALPAGKVYLSPMIDCFDGSVVSWTIGTKPNAELVNTMLDGAVALLGEGEHPIVHSDRGSHYRWPDWIRKIESAGLIRSMSKKGCSPDNAACEGFFMLISDGIMRS